MSVRKRQWFTRKQMQAYAKRLAKEAGKHQDRWSEHHDEAEQELAELLRLSKDGNTAAIEALKEFPPQEAWIVAYRIDSSRHIETFERKRDADARAAVVGVDKSKGTHIAPKKTPTVKEAGEMWLESCEADKLQKSAIAAYEQHLRLHIVPRLGTLRLAELTVPRIAQFRDDLRKGKSVVVKNKDGKVSEDSQKRSDAMVKRVLVSLGTMLANAQERGLVATNVVRGMKRHKKDRQQRRGKLKVGVDVPTREEIKQIIAQLSDRWRPILLTAMFSGLRASELRGLKWADVDLRSAKLHVRQRADRYREFGKPKSEAGERTIPLPPMVVNTLREWKAKCPKGPHDLAFPTGKGQIESHANILHRGFEPAQIAAGAVDDKGKPKYALHALRHFYASWCINRRQDGGLELPIKVVQERMGHSSITLTADLYSHMFPSHDDGTELKEAERFFVARR